MIFKRRPERFTSCRGRLSSTKITPSAILLWWSTEIQLLALAIFATQDDNQYASNDERNAQDLPRIQGIVEVEDILLLYILYKESHSESYCKEDSKELSSLEFLYMVLIKIEEDKTEDKICKRLVQACRMFRNGLSAELEKKAPREVGRITVKL